MPKKIAELKVAHHIASLMLHKMGHFSGFLFGDNFWASRRLPADITFSVVAALLESRVLVAESLVVEEEGDPGLLGVLGVLVWGGGLARPRPQQLSGGVSVGVGVAGQRGRGGGPVVRRRDVAEIRARN